MNEILIIHLTTNVLAHVMHFSMNLSNKSYPFFCSNKEFIICEDVQSLVIVDSDSYRHMQKLYYLYSIMDVHPVANVYKSTYDCIVILKLKIPIKIIMSTSYNLFFI